MAVPRQAVTASTALPAGQSRAGRVTGGGTAGNERLTAVNGAVLLVLLATLGVTIIQIGQLLWLHLFLGMLLIGPVVLKLGSTGYRFVRYYAGSPTYRHEGPPAALLRAMGPIVVSSTVIVFASGVALLFAGPSSRNALLPIHKVTFFVWLAFMALHILAHLPEILPALRVDYGRRPGLGVEATGRSGRVLALAGALTAGLVLAVLVIPEFGPWVHDSGLFHHHHG
jgi:hypothetical protein